MIYEYNATLERVVDGDTVWLEVDLGFRCRQSVELRLYGVDAPELVGATRAAGLASKAELERLLAQGPLRIVTYKAGRTDKYGRWLASIHVGTDRGALSVNDALIVSGHAVTYGQKPAATGQ